jgi:hypothetical protein
MTIGLKIFFGCVCGYFFVAAFIPRVRMRWGYSTRLQQPRMGAVTCMGWAIFFGGFVIPLPIPGMHFMFLPGAGLGLMAIGAFLDCVREPPTLKK